MQYGDLTYNGITYPDLDLDLRIDQGIVSIVIPNGLILENSFEVYLEDLNPLEEVVLLCEKPYLMELKNSTGLLVLTIEANCKLVARLKKGLG